MIACFALNHVHLSVIQESKLLCHVYTIMVAFSSIPVGMIPI